MCLLPQTLWQNKPKTLNVHIEGSLGTGVTAKDLILAIIGKFGVKFGTGYVLEYTGEAIRKLSMEERMTVCNMSIEAGARAGLISPDETTFEYLRDRRYAPEGLDFEAAVSEWKNLVTDEGAAYDHTVYLDASEIEPQVTWGTNPGMCLPISANVPDPALIEDKDERASVEQALAYMVLQGTPAADFH